MSRVGKLPIPVPAGLTVNIKGNKISVKGPKGSLSQTLTDGITASLEDGKITFVRPTENKRHKALHGLYRALTNNMAKGCSEGYKVEQELVGVGYRATSTGNMLDLILGYSHHVVFELPSEIKVATRLWKRSVPMQMAIDRMFLRLPIFGEVIRKATIARWTRTLSTMFAAGVPLVEALTSVGGAAGNHVYKVATQQIQTEVSTGSGLTVAMQNADVFPGMVIQMVSIGEESGQLDAMLGKVADFYEAEVDDAVEALSSLMEPMIMVILGTLIGGMVVAMYLPIFKLGSVV